uniref:Uncharacterized protein n=1 Tax=Glossina austeni TaxID=7395 RepID=A0A1A9UF60_GLOAU
MISVNNGMFASVELSRCQSIGLREGSHSLHIYPACRLRLMDESLLIRVLLNFAVVMLQFFGTQRSIKLNIMGTGLGGERGISWWLVTDNIVTNATTMQSFIWCPWQHPSNSILPTVSNSRIIKPLSLHDT